LHALVTFLGSFSYITAFKIAEKL